MKCANCGAEIKVGCVYCSVCGHEAQIVPDYNVLEDDWLKSMMDTENNKATQPKNNAGQKVRSSKQKKKKKNYTPLIAGIAVCCVLLGLTVFLVVREQRRNSFDYQYAQGMIAKQKKDYTKSISFLQRALELEEENTEVMMELARLYDLREDDDAKERMLERVIKIEPEHEEAYEMLLALYDSQKKYAKIMECFEELKDTDLEELFEDYLVAPPEFSEEEGYYNEEMEIRLSAQPDCTIYYALNGVDPVASGRVYDEAIPLKEGEVEIRAVAKDERGIYSEVAVAKYEIEFKAPDVPYVSPSSGTYTDAQRITITIPDNCSVYYTWDGTTPDATSAKYSSPLEMPAGNNILSVIAYDNHGLSSRVIRYNYIYQPEVEE